MFLSTQEFKNATITGHSAFEFEENSVGNHMNISYAIVFEKLHFQNVFRQHKTESRCF